ncbi:hypothetical protein B0H17DRAFT_1338151 [Mycena rosella]|uniref:Uncharacterized protein n=1 Tax=Mycena rosella TaxID=1033263 RepID=A0AAD7CNK2_MYCRO|nr:hypothetical protein B0H17DRAFT_1338151 [Mycena rosella]
MCVTHVAVPAPALPLLTAPTQLRRYVRNRHTLCPVPMTDALAYESARIYFIYALLALSSHLCDPPRDIPHSRHRYCRPARVRPRSWFHALLALAAAAILHEQL